MTDILVGEQYFSIMTNRLYEIVFVDNDHCDYKAMTNVLVYKDTRYAVELAIVGKIWILKNKIDSPIINKDMHGLNCKKCNFYNQYAEPNKGVDYICYECRV